MYQRVLRMPAERWFIRIGGDGALSHGILVSVRYGFCSLILRHWTGTSRTTTTRGPIAGTRYPGPSCQYPI